MAEQKFSEQAIRKHVEELARICDIPRSHQHNFVEDILAMIRRFRLQHLKSTLKEKRTGIR